MRILKLAIISIVVLFIIMTCLGLLLPSTVRVTRNITIHTPHDTLYHYLTNISKWKLWMQGMDSANIKITLKDNNGEGMVALIGGQHVSITNATKKQVETLWQNSRGAKQVGVFQMFYDTTNNSTNLNWYFEQKVSWYPWERLSTLANDKILGPFMENSLDKLKALSEQNRN